LTILATHFSLVLGAWRLRVRIDIDEPRDEPVRAARAATVDRAVSPNDQPLGHVARGRG
jgi:hypothetical protein